LKTIAIRARVGSLGISFPFSNCGIIEHLGQCQRDARFSTWLSRLAVNQCLLRPRKDRRVRFLYLDGGAAGEEVATLKLPDSTESPADALAHVELGAVLKTGIHRIPPLLRDVPVRRDAEEPPMPDVASRPSPSTLELRERMEKQFGRMVWPN
jgi:RNA polymerase sigma-70 factor (ECF subfamily)